MSDRRDERHRENGGMQCPKVTVSVRIRPGEMLETKQSAICSRQVDTKQSLDGKDVGSLFVVSGIRHRRRARRKIDTRSSVPSLGEACR